MPPSRTKDSATKPSQPPSARLLLAADRSAIRSALRFLLDHKIGISAVDEAATPAELVSKVTSQPPDLLILDWQLCGPRGVDLLRSLHAAQPTLRVLALSVRPEHRSAALAAGVDAFADEASSVDQLCAAVRALLGQPLESRRRLTPGDAAAPRGAPGAAPPVQDGTTP